MPRPQDTTTSPLRHALLEYKQQQNMTFAQMGERLGVTGPTMRRLVKHGRIPTLKFLRHLARFFQWTAEEVGIMAQYEAPPRRRGERDVA